MRPAVHVFPLGLPLALLLVTACSYQAGSFAYRAPSRATFAGARTTIGCVDLAVSRKPVVEDDSGGIVVQYEFGNRCDVPTTIDLQAVHAVGKTASGREVKLLAHDPDSELTPLRIDAKSVGKEAIAYRDERGEEVVSACVDVAPIAHVGAPQWACVPAAPDAEGSGSDADLGVTGDYVGNRNYGTHFGMWAIPMVMPQMFMDFGAQYRSVSVLSSNLPSQPTTSTRLTVPGFTSTFRFGGGGHHIYMAAELELGGVGGAADSVGAMPTPALYGGGAIATGVRGAVGPISLSAEVALGGRSVIGHDTPVGTGTVPGTSDAAGIVEGRVRAEVWLSPWMSLGAAVGSSMIRDEYLAGGFFSIHTRTYAGDRAH